jgi:hypothetical protein
MSLLESILFYRYVVPAEIPLQYRSFLGVDNAPLHHIEIQRCILIFPGLVPVLIAVSSTVFFPVRPSLVAIHCSASVQLVCSSLFSCHNGGSWAEIVQEVDGGRRDSARQAKQARQAVLIKTAISQAAAGTVGSK